MHRIERETFLSFYQKEMEEEKNAIKQHTSRR